jgi:hypothetical protein
MHDDHHPGDADVSPANTVARRGLVAGAVAAAAALALDSKQASASDGQFFVLGQGNTSTNDTTITNNGGNVGLRVVSTTGGAGTGIEVSGGDYGVVVTGGLFGGVLSTVIEPSANGVVGVTQATTGGGFGVAGVASSPNGTGVYGVAEPSISPLGVGVIGNAGTLASAQPPEDVGIGVFGTAESDVGIGGVFAGGRAAVRLLPSDEPVPPTAATLHDVGEMVISSAGRLFLCRVSGSPGTWVELGGPQLVLLPTPERFVDTRSGLGGVQGPVGSGSTNTFSLTTRNGESGSPGLQIPDRATSIVGNLTAIGADGVALGSYITLWPGGGRPTVSNVNFGPSTATGAVANSFVAGLADVSGGRRGINVYNNAACDFIIDVSGYYM